MTSTPVAIYPDNLETALRRLVKYDIGRLPLVEGPRKEVGRIHTQTKYRQSSCQRAPIT
ncbi:MAG: hypothetical protein R6U44_12165 [Archaeoglobaceae archaeon]